MYPMLYLWYSFSFTLSPLPIIVTMAGLHHRYRLNFCSVLARDSCLDTALKAAL